MKVYFKKEKQDTDSYVFDGPVLPIFINWTLSNLTVPQECPPKLSRIGVASKGTRFRMAFFPYTVLISVTCIYIFPGEFSLCRKTMGFTLKGRFSGDMYPWSSMVCRSDSIEKKTGRLLTTDLFRNGSFFFSYHKSELPGCHPMYRLPEHKEHGLFLSR